MPLIISLHASGSWKYKGHEKEEQEREREREREQEEYLLVTGTAFTKIRREKPNRISSKRRLLAIPIALFLGDKLYECWFGCIKANSAFIQVLEWELDDRGKQWYHQSQKRRWEEDSSWRARIRLSIVNHRYETKNAEALTCDEVGDIMRNILREDGKKKMNTLRQVESDKRLLWHLSRPSGVYH